MMSERWRRTVGQIGRVEPDMEKLRAAALEGPRIPRLGEDVARPTGSRVVAAIVAIALAGATFTFVQSGFGETDASGPAGPNPATICGTSEDEGQATRPDLVALADYEIETSSLAEEGFPLLDLASVPRDALLDFYRQGPDPSSKPADGWREVYEREDRVVLAAPDDAGSDRWYYVAFAKYEGQWRASGWGFLPIGETVMQRGEGLRLEWRSEIVYDRGALQEGIWLVNERDEPWIDEEGGEYWGIVHLLDPASGEEVAQGHGAVFGTGKSYNVAPGDAVQLPLGFGNLDRVPDGTYAAVACVPDLGLASPLGTLTLTGRDESEQSGSSPQGPNSNEYPKPPTSGYWILFPDAPEPLEGGSDGAVRIVALTNLPDGTLSLTSTDRGGMCCSAVEAGRMIVRASRSACDKVSGAHNPGVSITITTDADIGQHVIGVPIGAQPPQQPDSVLSILGAGFEHVTGDQVVERGGERALVASVTYAWPEPLCLY